MSFVCEDDKAFEVAEAVVYNPATLPVKANSSRLGLCLSGYGIDPIGDGKILVGSPPKPRTRSAICSR
jgi:hypothetical protein